MQSIAQTRHRFRQQLCGVEEGPDLYEDEMADDEQREEELRRQKKGKARRQDETGERSASGSGINKKKGKS